MLSYFHASESLYWLGTKNTPNYNFDRGQRALASCLGGGDLDGDDFNLILDVSYFYDT
jgi:hypothetical protein